ncbi:hypothetical protein GCM10007901_12110 [Dyella acidisoli]|uniref:Uncharacterized protein n=1 Tax=Dyella acidisoli TaxID=1867834 RepID=A0ABQ5XKS8_9GAMM|nr:hypothetical protein GCM10007901_12110 [Dyella acidisoli]
MHTSAVKDIVRTRRHRRYLAIRKALRCDQIHASKAHGAHRPRRTADVPRVGGTDEDKAEAVGKIDGGHAVGHRVFGLARIVEEQAQGATPVARPSPHIARSAIIAGR